MAFTPKDWRDDPDHSTPINAVALEDMETRLGAYADSPTVKIATVNRAAGQSINNVTVTVVSWDTEREDLPGWFAAGNPTYIQPTEAGIYAVTVQACWADNSTANRSVHLQLNGTVTGAFAADGAVLAGNVEATARFEQAQGMHWIGRLAANDKLSVWAYQSTGAALNFGGLSRPAGSSANAEFSVVKLGS